LTHEEIEGLMINFAVEIYDKNGVVI